MHAVVTRIVAVLVLSTSPLAADWPVEKTYQASTNPSFLVTTDRGVGSFRGWAVAEQAGTLTRTPPGVVDGLAAEADSVPNGGKLKYSTSGSPWTFETASGTTTAVLWKLRVSATASNMPALQIGTGGVINRRFRIDFKSNITTPTGVASGWTGSENTVIDEGGKLDTNGARFLPMALNQWHSVRFQVAPDAGKPGGYRFDAWIDEGLAYGQVLHVGGYTTQVSSSAYVQWGAIVTTGGVVSWATHFIAWGQNSEIPPRPTQTLDCDNPANCAQPVCLCQIVPENTLAACSNGFDDDGDGQVDCADTDCAAISHCGQDKPEYVLTLIRQIGHWQNSCNPYCGSVIFVSVYDENGTPIDGVTIKDPLRGVTMVTAKDPGQGPDGQSGHARHQAVGLTGTYRFYVVSDSGGTVASQITPELYSSVPPDGNSYSWQMEFMKKSKRSVACTLQPTGPTYIFDSVALNSQGGGNTTLDRDHAGLFTAGGEMFGQTFVANCDRIISARFEMTRGFLLTFQYQASIHSLLRNPPLTAADIGPQIGPARAGPANMIDSEWWTQMLNWPLDPEGTSAQSVRVVPGQTYFVKIRRADVGGQGYPVFTHFVSDGNYYPSGQAFRQAAGDQNLTTDNAAYDLVGYIVGATVGNAPPPCVNDPVFDVVGGGPDGLQPDGAVDQQDFGVFQSCMTGPQPAGPEFDDLPRHCQCMDLNQDRAIDDAEFTRFQQCMSGPGVPAARNCDN